MKAIMISIKPKWVAKILNGEKTIEIRKTMPKCDLPIDVYIYCTKNGGWLTRWYDPKTKERGYCGYNKENNNLNGKVVAKFTLNKVEEMYYCDEEYLKPSCLNIDELFDYLKEKVGYAWHISNLEIFDKPKELSEFNQKWYCKGLGKDFLHPIGKAPQSWCYCESEE